MIPSLCTFIASGGGVGYLPAPGTCATLLLGIPAALALNHYTVDAPERLFCALLAITVVASLIISVAISAELQEQEKNSRACPPACPPKPWCRWKLAEPVGPDKRRRDPQWIVLDEVVGFCWAFAGAPLTISSLVIAVTLFRLLDITKPGPVGWSESAPGAFGILLDDVVAGIGARIMLIGIGIVLARYLLCL